MKFKAAGLCAGVALLVCPTFLAAQLSEPTADLPAQEVADEAAVDPIDDETAQWIKEFTESLTPRVGSIPIAGAKATLTVPDGYFFLDAKDARRVLEEAWNNPPDDSVLGMIMAAGATPFDGASWAATVTYLDDGYVSDEDAAKVDYASLLADLQKSAREENEWRLKNGYDAVEIVGWAETPAYDAETHKMYWAKELKFGDSDANTLNYDIRVLGRRGVLVIGFVAGMDQLAAVKSSAPAVLGMADFDAGSTYAEYQPGVDKKAAYGIAGLVLGAAIAKKTGLLAAILLFGKKFIVLILAGIAAVFGVVRRFFVKTPGA